MSDRLQTQRKLINATRQIIIERGIEACTLENICTLAGHTRGAFYSNFGTKDALIAAVAEDEYERLIAALQSQIKQWATVSADQSKPVPAVMEDLLMQAIEAIGYEPALFLIHAEMLARAIRDAHWGTQFVELNEQFNAELAQALTQILRVAGRRPRIDSRALAHSVIAIVTRAAAIDSWRKTLDTLRENPTDVSVFQHPTDSQCLTVGAANEVLQTVTLLLTAASEPHAA